MKGLIHAISRIDFKFLLYLVEGKFKKFKENVVKEIDFELFIPLLLGIGLAILTMSKVISYFLATYPALTYTFFFGLILSSAFIVYKHVGGLDVKNVAFLLIGFLFAIIFVGLNPIQANHTSPVIFFSGMVAICAMILPGISGAFILLILNQYEYMINVLNNMQFTEIIVFCFGALIGILSFSRAFDYMLNHHKSITMSFLGGVDDRTLRLPYERTVASMDSVIPVIVVAVIGFILGIVLEKGFEGHHKN